MAELERIGSSPDKDLLLNFDRLVARQSDQGRPEAIRDPVRQQLSRINLVAAFARRRTG